MWFSRAKSLNKSEGCSSIFIIKHPPGIELGLRSADFRQGWELALRTFALRSFSLHYFALVALLKRATGANLSFSL